ncbi:hypothetical protein QF000_007947 [Paraburkholderia atlantica]|uniref:hypothetical protein n=1 Tax=Paraburkholderia atlantica TaxID=2654982 RepID=UPI003D1FE031
MGPKTPVTEGDFFRQPLREQIFYTARSIFAIPPSGQSPGKRNFQGKITSPSQIMGRADATLVKVCSAANKFDREAGWIDGIMLSTLD